MSGIIFLRSKQLDVITSFYQKKIGMNVWLEQGGCQILQDGNLLLGFCAGEEAETCGVVTFFLPDRQSVDAAWQKHQDIAMAQPAFNPQYQIYHFYARDPEGRKLEFQSFEHHLQPFISATQNLMYRRSIRAFTDEPVDKATLDKVFELCRYSPTANNLQGYYYTVINSKEIVQKIVALRGPAGKPLLAAPLAIAIASRGEKPDRRVQDACIAAYHLLLAAHTYGLGTCWVTDMDKPLVKELLGIPDEDYVACLTPLGWPLETKALPSRHEIQQFVRYVD
ncbi:MAG: nitroreductase [Candidatus Cloacimonetes bacterium]|nr:nitroreductase family protein [Candidatus Cloacimonadota bacterium]NLO12426.1 nitroreductase [Candidatus Cloacimonadota bacterium]